MTVFKTYNPLKEQATNEIHNILYSIANSTSRTICFYNDNVGWYFNPIRHLDNVELCLTDARYYNLYALLRDDIYLSKTVFTELNAGYNWNMIDWFEERVHSEANPVICSHILFLLHNLSDATDDRLGMYDSNNFDRVLNKTKELDCYYIKNKNIHYNTIPDDAFVISLQDDIPDREGIIITREKGLSYDLIKKVGREFIYYKEK